MAETLVIRATVSDACIGSSCGARISQTVSGMPFTGSAGNFSAKSGGMNRCSNCSRCTSMNVCPYVLSTVSRSDEITYNGATYKFLRISAGGPNSTYCEATYQKLELTVNYEDENGNKISANQVTFTDTDGTTISLTDISVS